MAFRRLVHRSAVNQRQAHQTFEDKVYLQQLQQEGSTAAVPATATTTTGATVVTAVAPASTWVNDFLMFCCYYDYNYYS